MKLTGKTILILSPQSWGTMFISKHHYAVELAKRGNTVYYLNPPGEGHDGAASFGIAALAAADNLFLVTQRLSFPGQIRFHLPGIFRSLMKRHLKQLLKFLPHKPDIIWSFDLNGLYDFDSFPKEALRIFHPVDEPLTTAALRSGQGAHIVFSVTEEIISKFEGLGVPQYCLNHGVAPVFFQQASRSGAGEPDGTIRVGISGNMLRPDIDRAVLLQIIGQHPDCIFECWGAYASKASNIGGVTDPETTSFIKVLQQSPNVILHGPVAPDVLAANLPRMNLFLICYDVEKDQSKGTNYHKILEYLAAGGVVVSNNVTTYSNRPDLVQMVESRTNNQQLPALFNTIVKELGKYNAPEAVEVRKSFARANAYAAKIERIESCLNMLD